MRRHLSSPSSSLLDQAGLSAQEVDTAMDELVWAKMSAVLRAHHPLVRHVGDATGINLVQISRRSRNLLIEIEQHAKDGPGWQYREHTPRRCIFSCRGQVPAMIETALQGELLEKLVIPALALNKVTIANVSETGDGWLTINVVPDWREF
jgi:hypothetical protein